MFRLKLLANRDGSGHGSGRFRRARNANSKRLPTVQGRFSAVPLFQGYIIVTTQRHISNMEFQIRKSFTRIDFQGRRSSHARALACCHGERRPGGADSHKALRDSELGIAEAKDSNAKGDYKFIETLPTAQTHGNTHQQALPANCQYHTPLSKHLPKSLEEFIPSLIRLGSISISRIGPRWAGRALGRR